ncbi:MAG: hypothetical protein AAF936_03920 [Pseudomonadota bacterium]
MKPKRRPSLTTRIKRVVKALTQTGLKVQGVRLRDDGDVEIITDGEIELIKDQNEWDEVLPSN